MHKVQESSSEHQLLAKKYRQRRQTQGKFASVNEFAYSKSMRESDKENQSIELNKSSVQVKFGERSLWTPQDCDVGQFCTARISSALNLIDKTVIDCFMVKSQAERSISNLDNKSQEELQVLEAFRTQLIQKINASLDEVVSKMKVDTEQHSKLLGELVEFTSKNLEVLASLRKGITKIHMQGSKPLTNEQNVALETGRSSTLMIGSQLETKKQGVACHICLDKVKKEAFTVIDKLASCLFDEMALKATSNSILLVGTEKRSLSQTSRTSSRESLREPKRAITNFLRRIAKPKQTPMINLSNMSTCPQESLVTASRYYIDLEHTS